MNMFSVAKTMFKELEKFKKDITQHMENEEILTYLQTEEFKEIKQKRYKQLINEFKEIAEMEIDIREAYKEVVEKRGLKNQDRLFEDTTSSHNQNGKTLKPFLITIRPECQTLNPDELISKMDKFMERKMFDKDPSMELCYSLEQTCNKDDPELGKGIHAHLIAWSNIPKSDLVKNSISTFNKICKPEGVHIKPITHMDRAMKYITGEEKGGDTKEKKLMKISHAEGDKAWRTKLGLKDL